MTDTAEIDRGRIDTPQDVRTHAHALSVKIGRVHRAFGRMWTTAAAVDEARELLAEIAAEALALRGKL